MNKSYVKIGSYSSALLLLSTGAALLGHWYGLNSIAWLMKASPVFLILLGCEFLLYANKEEQTKLAWVRIITSIGISVVALTAFLGFEWLWGDDQAQSLPNTEQMISSDMRELNIENVNGSVTLLTHDERTVKIETEVKHPLFQLYNGEIEVEVYEEDDTFHIETDAPHFQFLFIHTRPFINLTVYVPEDHPLDVDIDQKNGKIVAHGVSLLDTFRGKTTNGRIELHEMEGDFRLTSTNGRITADSIKGTIDARSTNGKVDIDGDIGEMLIRTTNGSITATSTTIDADWNIRTTNGALTLTLPASGSIDLSARTTNGSVIAPDAFHVDGKRVTGQLGSGDFEVEARTTNGRLTIYTEGPH